MKYEELKDFVYVQMTTRGQRTPFNRRRFSEKVILLALRKNDISDVECNRLLVYTDELLEKEQQLCLPSMTKLYPLSSTSQRITPLHD